MYKIIASCIPRPNPVQLEARRKEQRSLRQRLGGNGAGTIVGGASSPPAPPSASSSSQAPKVSEQATSQTTNAPATKTAPRTPARVVKATAPPKEPEPIPKLSESPASPSPPPCTSLPDPPTSSKGDNNPNAMNVVFVGAECAPWSKTGGLGDVMHALPKALADRGHRVAVVAPRYAEYDNAWETGVRIRLRVFNSEQEVGFFHCFRDGVDFIFVDHSCFRAWGHDIYGGSRMDILFRCALLSKAALEVPWHVPCGGVPYGDDNLVFVANDWHTALLPVYLQAHYRDHGQLTYARSALVLHNVAHQGRGPMSDLQYLEIPEPYLESFRLNDPIGGEHANVMKAGVEAAHRLVAVSRGYAWECQTQDGGWGLDAVFRNCAWKLSGVVNGIDPHEWSPEVDEHLVSDGYQQYNKDNMAGKSACKAALQAELGLPVDRHVPLLGFIGRLDYQKGVDIIRDSYDWIMSEGCQLVMLGSGRGDLEDALRDMEARSRDKCRGWVGFSARTAHRITAGADILLMPSRFEPCGLNQLYAMAYGTTPVVHAVGGLRDTVQAFDPFNNTGTGWAYEWSDAEAFRHALGNAIYTYRQFPDSFKYGV